MILCLAQVLNTHFPFQLNKGSLLEVGKTRVTNYLLAVEGVGAVFVGVFLAAYLGGLPTTTVLHKYLAFRIPLAVFGSLLFAFVLAGTAVLAYLKSSKEQ